ncbi:MAG: hypothetical protein EOM19_04150, partial [Candidatus Moranbacteria bacterium]|nr:hypothetical protein [Candidatus Moranbacteria bacterium]
MEFFSKKYITRNFFLLALSFVGIFYPSFFSAQAAFPVISNVSVSNVTAQGATVSWTTDIPASSLVDFGTSTAYGTTMGNPDALVTSHSVVLTGLFPLTQHYFQVRSSNGGDQTINNNGGTGFTVTTTAAPVISQVRLISVSDTQAIITFRTDIPAYPYIGYGLTDSYGSLIGDEENFGVNHSITLYGLTPGKQYYYKPRVGDVYKNYTYFPGNNFFTTSGPYLQSITTTTSNGAYGPGTQIPIVATYQENVVSGSANVTVTLNTGVQIDLNQVSGNTISGLYVVGSTGSGQNISSLAVSSIEYQNVCDSDGFCYRGTTLPSININDNSTVAIDTTAPVFSNIQPIDIWPRVFNSITTASDISYTLSEKLQSGTIKFLRTSGSLDSGSPHTCTLTGEYLNFGTRNNFNMNNCQEGVPALVDGSVYTIRFEGTDLVGNNATRVDRVSMQFDTISPTLISFTSSTPNGTYGAGSIITIIPNFNEPARGSMRVILDTGVEVTLSYNGVEDVFRGFYTVGDISSGQASQDLTVTQISYMNVSDLAGNTTVNTSMTGIQGNNLGDNSNIVIDTAIADAPSLVQFMTDPINNA